MTTIEHQGAAELIFYELKESKTPLTIGELSKTLNLPMTQVSHVIKDMPDKYPICQKNDKYYVPKFCPLAWIGAFVTIFIVLNTFLEVMLRN